MRSVLCAFHLILGSNRTEIEIEIEIEASLDSGGEIL